MLAGSRVAVAAAWVGAGADAAGADDAGADAATDGARDGAARAVPNSVNSAARVVVREPKRFTPLAFPLLVDRTRNKVSSEKLGDRIKRMQLALERAAG